MSKTEFFPQLKYKMKCHIALKNVRVNWVLIQALRTRCNALLHDKITEVSLTYNNFSFALPVKLRSTFTCCGRKEMRLATPCTNRQCCCLPLHMAVRLTPAVDSVQVWTCSSCYAIVQSVWSEAVFVRCITKMDRQKIQQCCAIKFCVKLGESAAVTYVKFQPQSREQVFRWHKSFLEGREQVQDEPRAGRLSTSKTDDNVESVRSLMRSDRRLTLRTISSELNLNRYTVHQILTRDLEMRKVCAKMVPKNLKTEQKANRRDLLYRIEREPEFFSRIITGDESWILE